MNKLFRYLIFALLIVGVGYAVYYYINKPTSVVTEKVEGEISVDKKVALDGETQPDLSSDQSLAQVEGEKPAEETSEFVIEEEKEEVVPEEKKEEEMNKDSKPAKR
jgi:hypothetical protein